MTIIETDQQRGSLLGESDRVRKQYESLLHELFESKNTQEFKNLLHKIIDFIYTWKFYKSIRSIRIYITHDYTIFNYIMCRYYTMGLFDIVLMKNKDLLPILKKHNIECGNTSFTYPPVYIPLMKRDIDTVDYIVKNGCPIINESGYCFYDCGRRDEKDMVDLLIDMNNTTSIRYVYNQTNLEALLKKCDSKNFFRYVYDHILPY